MSTVPGARPPLGSAIHTENPAIRGLPPNVTFNDLIRRNKRKSVLLMLGMGLLVVIVGCVVTLLIGLYVGAVDELNLWRSLLFGAIAAALVATAAGTWSFYSGSNAVLRMSRAVEIEKRDDPQLFNVVEELSIAAGIPPPKVYLIDDASLNAFATGRDPQHAAVAITKGLREKLTRDELAGVMAHEISHIRFYDIRFAMLMATLVGLIVFACDALFQVIRYHFWFGGGRMMRGGRSRGRGGDGKGAAIIMVVVLVIAILLAVVAPTLAMMIRFAFSRQREFLADAGAVELTRYPQGLMGALEKLGACRQPLESANRATVHMYIVNPLKNVVKEGHELNSAFRTHPPLHDRIARIGALLGQITPPGAKR